MYLINLFGKILFDQLMIIKICGDDYEILYKKTENEHLKIDNDHALNDIMYLVYLNGVV